MKKPFWIITLILALCCAAIGQAPTTTIPSPPQDFIADLPAYQSAASQVMADLLSNWTWAKNAIQTLGTNQATDEGNISGLQAGLSQTNSTLAALQGQVNAIPAGPQGPPGPPGVGTQGATGPQGSQGIQGIPGINAPLQPPIVVPLVMPWGTTGYSNQTLSSTLTEWQNTGRTQETIDFTNVHSLRVCLYMQTGAAGVLELDQSTGGAWTPLVSAVSLNHTGPACSAWTAYTGIQSDATVRIAVSGTGTPAVQFISVQMK